MEGKMQRAILYAGGGILIIIILVMFTAFINRDPNQNRLNTMLENTHTAISSLESINANSLTFSEQNWTATAIRSLNSDEVQLQNNNAVALEDQQDQNFDTISDDEAFELTANLLEENTSLYHQLDSERQEALRAVAENQQLLLEEFRTLNQ